ncbi:MAG: BPL-N domain-containing protein, partial [Desulfomonilaceae bacterium]
CLYRILSHCLFLDYYEVAVIFETSSRVATGCLKNQIDWYDCCASLNQKLFRGIEILKGDKEEVLLPPDRYPSRVPRIGLYTGSGTSHSWLWFVDLFDRMFFCDVIFLDEKMVQGGLLKNLDIFAMSGGDTIRIAEGLGAEGAVEIEDFIRAGGVYIGSCAGAYLPLKSSKQYLDRFNFVDIKIANLSKTEPTAIQSSRKATTAYGCDYVYHPVREAVRLSSTRKGPFCGVGNFLAPLYGGPSMMTTNSSEILARYEGFTDKTMFLVDETLAQKTLFGKVAAARSEFGHGALYLFGPHFEHPHFPEANYLVAAAIFWDMKNANVNKIVGDDEVILDGVKKKELLRDIRREISNARIVSVGLEATSVRWAIGCKIYQPEKIRVFLEAIWKRLSTLERLPKIRLSNRTLERITPCACEVTRILREMKSRIDDGLDTLGIAPHFFDSLRRLTMFCLQIYFDSLQLDN